MSAKWKVFSKIDVDQIFGKLWEEEEVIKHQCIINFKMNIWNLMIVGNHISYMKMQMICVDGPCLDL